MITTLLGVNQMHVYREKLVYSLSCLMIIFLFTFFLGLIYLKNGIPFFSSIVCTPRPLPPGPAYESSILTMFSPPLKNLIIPIMNFDRQYLHY